MTRRQATAHQPLTAAAGDRLTFRCVALDTVTGYGQHAIHTVRQLQRHGVEVALEPMKVWRTKHPVPREVMKTIAPGPRDQWEMLLAPPDVGARDRATVWFSMWESNRLPAGSVEKLNQAAAVIVPCAWNQMLFDANGVSRPIHNVPMGYDPNVFEPRPWPDGPFTFGAGGRLAHGGARKGVLKVVRAFLQAFPDRRDVRLELKVHEDCDLQVRSDTRITVIRESWSERQMAEWYERLHCYVTMATAEGFGFMPFQAMVTGRPAIGSLAHGHAEFMTPENACVVPHQVARAEHQAGPKWNYAGYWFEPVASAVVQAMRSLASDPAEAQRMGVRAAAHVAPMTWDLYGERLVTALRASRVLTR